MRGLLPRLVAALFAVAGAVFAAKADAPAAARADTWSADEVALLASLRLKEAGTPPADPSNAFEANPAAAALGRALFDDRRLSRNGAVSCASCHSPQGQFEDGRPLGQGLATGTRRTMPLMGAAHSPWLFWDGRKDSLWSQALGPLEDAAEHGGNRTRYAGLIAAHYRAPYEQVFGALPDLSGLPDDAGPLGTPAEQAAWRALDARRRDAVNRVFANIGKAIAAFERTLSYGESRFDRYAQAVVESDAAGRSALSAQEVRGLRLFIGQGQCVTCHGGPMLSDHAFHNTGVPPLKRDAPDPGRAAGARKLLADEFNCLGPYSDAQPGQCEELRFLATDDPAQLAAFRTPSLRNVALRPPYMHAGQFATLEQAIEHYARSPQAALGHSELARPGEAHAERRPIKLTADEIRDVAAFLRTLSGPVLQAGR